jgi:hypothetical protein
MRGIGIELTKGREIDEKGEDKAEDVCEMMNGGKGIDLSQCACEAVMYLKKEEEYWEVRRLLAMGGIIFMLKRLCCHYEIGRSSFEHVELLQVLMASPSVLV